MKTYWTPEMLARQYAAYREKKAQRAKAERMMRRILMAKRPKRPRQPRRWTEERLNHLRALAASGITMREAAKELDMSQSNVANIASRYGVKFGGGGWTEAKLEQLRALAASGMSTFEAAAEMKMSRAAIAHAASRYGVRFGRLPSPDGEMRGENNARKSTKR